MKKGEHFVVFSLDDNRYALRISEVERIVHTIAITPLPETPQIVFGVIKVQEKIIPVINIRKRFGLPDRGINLNDQIIITRTPKRFLALVVDAVNEVLELKDLRTVAAEEILPSLRYMTGIIQTEGGLVIINDLDQFLSLEEEEVLDSALLKKREEY